MLKVMPGERHATNRFLERSGSYLTDELKHRLIREIKRTHRRLGSPKQRPTGAKKSNLTGLAAHPVSSLFRNQQRRQWRVDLDGKRYRLVIDEQQWIIVTLLSASELATFPGACR